MGLPIVKESVVAPEMPCYRGNSLISREITHPTTQNKDLSLQTKLITSYLTIDRNMLRELIPEIKGVRSTTSLRLLIVVCDLGECTRSTLRKELSTDNTNINKCVDYLVDIELLSVRDMPVYVPCFNKHKFNKGYSITDKGVKLLEFIFSKIFV